MELKVIRFTPNSRLRIIEREELSRTPLKTIEIPASVVEIKDDWNKKTLNLSNISIDIYDSCQNLNHISIPSSVEELQNGWCSSTPNLVDVEIIQSSQQNFVYFNNEFILGKSDINSNNYDVIAFARHDLEVALIPSFIK